MHRSVPSPVRFAFIDALRGLAACYVAAFHFYNHIADHYRFARPVHQFLELGWSGVDIFFVISGFVIAYSLRHVAMTPRYFANFLLRRSVRLDPPYWTTILLKVALVAWLSTRLGQVAASHITGPQLLAHLFYMQDLLGLGNIVEVFWTLCIELQFYLVFCLLLGMAQWLVRRFPSRVRTPEAGLLASFLPLAVLSLLINTRLLSLPIRGLFVPYWSLFQLGALGCWVYEQRARSWPFWAYAAGLLAIALAHLDIGLLVGLGTAGALLLVGQAGRLHKWLSGPVLQYLGRTSYSIYLMQGIGGRLVQAAGGLLAAAPTLAMAAGLLAASFAVLLTAAHLMYSLLEKPSTELSRRLKSDAVPARSGVPALGLVGK